MSGFHPSQISMRLRPIPWALAELYGPTRFDPLPIWHIAHGAHPDLFTNSFPPKEP